VPGHRHRPVPGDIAGRQGRRPAGRRRGAVSVGWFATRELPDGVFLIAEPAHVNSFLVVGEERAALIDSGLGIDRIRPVAEALPDGFDPDAWTLRPGPPSRPLRADDVIDLGGRSLRVLHTPGHTPDSICLLDERRGILFGGDTINTGPIYGHMPDSNLEAFAA